MLDSSKVRRSISCYSLPAIGPEEEVANQTEKRREMFEALHLRREALEEALGHKMTELKALCMREAEMTGELPPETPLVPNEPLPQIRRRMRTEFTLNDKLLMKPKTKEDEILSKLELEFEIQSKIVCASLKLMNEVHSRKTIKKQRKQNYQQAIAKLNDLETKLLPMRQKVEEGRMAKQQKKQLIDSYNLEYSQQVEGPLDSRGKGFAEPKRAKKRKNKMPRDQILSTSTPSSPVKFRETPRSRPLSPATAFIPISPAIKRSLKARPFSATLPRAAESNSSSGKASRLSNSSSEHDTVSMSSESTGAGSVIIRSDLPPSGQGMNKNKNRLMPHVQPSFLRQFDRKPRHEGRKENHQQLSPCLSPSLGSPTDQILEQPFLKRSNTVTGGSFVGSVTREPPVEDENLIRHNSLENSRRKSYISAIQSPPHGNNHHQHYHNHHPSSRLSKKGLPKNPPPSPPHEYVNLAQRPLPSPPISRPASVSSTRDDEVKRQINGPRHMTRTPVEHVRPEKGHDISCKAVRSSVIRTPVAITISTSSSETPHNNNTAMPPPPPPPPPQSPTPTPTLTPAPTPVSVPASSRGYDTGFAPNSSATPAPPSPSQSSASSALLSILLSAPPLSRGPSPVSSHRRTPTASVSRNYEFDEESVSSISQKTSSYTSNVVNKGKAKNKAWVETCIDSHQYTANRPASVLSQRRNASPVPKEDYRGRDEADDEVHAFTQKAAFVSDAVSVPNAAPTPTASLYSATPRSTEADMGRTSRPVSTSIALSPTAASRQGVEVNVLSVGHFQPYWEETKPYELSDFYKYSTKHRKQSGQETTSKEQATNGSAPSLRQGHGAHPTPAPDREVTSRRGHMSVTHEKVSTVSRKVVHEIKRQEKTESPDKSNFSLNDSFVTKSVVSEDFHEEMLEWYEEKLKKATVV